MRQTPVAVAATHSILHPSANHSLSKVWSAAKFRQIPKAAFPMHAGDFARGSFLARRRIVKFRLSSRAECRLTPTVKSGRELNV
jgi:hypothetical protein